MSDRELLELAAKAAGIEGEWSAVYDCLLLTETQTHEGCDTWDPLNDDGDALRLAAGLSLCVFVNGMFVRADCKHCSGGDIGYFEENTARNDGCIFKSTRRAIVRAAAAIGESPS